MIVSGVLRELSKELPKLIDDPFVIDQLGPELTGSA
jgi:hypothetical protein